MKKKINIGVLYFGIGSLLNVFSLFFGDRLSDFTVGFTEGLALVTMLAGIVYMLFYIKKPKTDKE